MWSLKPVSTFTHSFFFVMTFIFILKKTLFPPSNKLITQKKTLELINNECTRDSSCLVMTLDHKVTHTFFSFTARSPAESCVFLHRGSWRCFVGGSVCRGANPESSHSLIWDIKQLACSHLTSERERQLDDRRITPLMKTKCKAAAMISNKHLSGLGGWWEMFILGKQSTLISGIK